MINMRLGQDVGEILRFNAKEQSSYKDFYLEKGKDFTKGYLSGFEGLRKYFLLKGNGKNSNKFLGAKDALEEMVKKE